MQVTKEDMKIKLPGNTWEAVSNYYFNRDNQKTKKWDKSADLQAIDKAAFSEGFTSVQACAGTFWMTHENGYTYQFDESDFEKELEGKPLLKSDLFGAIQPLNQLMGACKI